MKIVVGNFRINASGSGFSPIFLVDAAPLRPQTQLQFFYDDISLKLFDFDYLISSIITKTTTHFTTVSIMKIIQHLITFISFLTTIVIANANANANNNQKSSSIPFPKCERLKTSLTYSQENAPQDISAVLPLIVERVNRELSGVIDVEVLFTGSEIHRRVGKHTVQCSVTRLLTAAAIDEEEEGAKNDVTVDQDGREVVTQCFLVPFTILDVDECNVPNGHSMRHECVYPAQCVNTQGSYECICPRSEYNSHNHHDGNDDNDYYYKNIKLASSEDEELAMSFWKTITSQEEMMHRSPWEKSLSSSKYSSCPNKVSTYGCCDADGHSNDGRRCRSTFKCPIDPCSSTTHKEFGNDCVSTATCVKAKSPLDVPTYTCQCPSPLMGSGHKCRKGIDIIPPTPKVNYDGVTPTEETIQNKFYCGCTKPIIDVCAGYNECTGKNQVCAVKESTMEPHCVCKSGYVHVDNFGCVDESPPTLKLRHDDNDNGVTILKQGDTYKEYAVDVIDPNAEDYKRSLKIAYSRPLPDGCETKIGSFQVNYTVAMPWTNPPYARVTRNVVIEDIDECSIDVKKYETQCPQIVPHCDVEHGATCKNTNGSYTCQCPKYTSGDGFKFMSSIKIDDNGNYIDAPEGYTGGTGCVDTSKPVIKVLGPNPKIFRVPKTGGLSGAMQKAKKDKHNQRDSNLLAAQREGYEDDIKKMISVTSGAELCATHTRTEPRPVDCVQATDPTYLGNVDLSSKVTIGSPIRESTLEWKVPYNVMDNAGNVATTVWRRIVVEEVDLFDMEERIRIDILADKDLEVKQAVRVALDKERFNQQKRPADNNNSMASCPACPICHKGEKGERGFKVNDDCEERIKNLKQTCEGSSKINGEHLFLQQLLRRMESFTGEAFSSTLIIMMVLIFVIFIQIMRMIINAVTGNDWYYLNEDDERKELEMLKSVTYFSPDSRQRQNHNTNTPTPTQGTSPMPATTRFSQRNGAVSGQTMTSPTIPTASYFSPEGRHR